MHGDVDAALERWAAGTADDVAVARVLYESGLRVHLAGQMMVRLVEAADVAGARAFRRDTGDAFLSQPFEEALASFRDRQLMSAEEFYALRDKYKQGGFAAVRIASEALRERARAAIEANLATGASLDETIQRIRNAELALGIEPQSHAYLETVVRTNAAVAYGAGRYAAMTDPAVIAARPWWQFLSSLDSRVCGICRPLDGKVFAADSPEAQTYAPPLHFNDRCSMVSRSQGDIERLGLVPHDGLLDGVMPQPGFDGAPDVLQ